ncbi:MAG: hypothetical protein E7Z86_08585 [Methanosphaera stadtmanae]|nr:hypothetical protein [Methanosphaera stadtmanae]
MDKTIIYKINDMLTQENENFINLKIITKGFPIEEKVLYDQNGQWNDDINTLEIDDNLKARLNEFLEDNNKRLIIDLLDENDTYYTDSYKLKIKVENLEIIDNYS